MSSGGCLGYSPCFVVVVHLSEPQSNTLFTLVLNIRILFLLEKDGVFKGTSACMVFPILLLTIRKMFVLLYILSSDLYFTLLLGLSSLLSVSIDWCSSAYICLYMIVGRCHLQSLDHPIA